MLAGMMIDLIDAKSIARGALKGKDFYPAQEKQIEYEQWRKAVGAAIAFSQ